MNDSPANLSGFVPGGLGLLNLYAGKELSMGYGNAVVQDTSSRGQGAGKRGWFDSQSIT